MYLGNLITAVSLRKCFYLSALVLVLSTLVAVAIIIKLSPLESVKCQSETVTAAVEWSTLANNPNKEFTTTLESTTTKKDRGGKGKDEDRRPSQITEERVAKIAEQLRNKASLPLIKDDGLAIEPNYNVHIFYYAWYRSKKHDGVWRHWNHDYLPHWKRNDKKIYPLGAHSPPADIGANYYPNLGCYSSMDPQIIDLHMRELKEIGIGVAVVSWSPPTSTENTDSVMPDLLDAAYRYKLKIAPHIEPYEGRNPINLIEHLRYLFSRYGSHPALYRLQRESDGAILPVVYIYDSYVFPSSAWWELLSDRGNLTLRGTELDAIYVGLLVDAQHKGYIKKSHFDGFYTYFGINGFTYGSSWKNWKDLNKFANQNGLLFVPSLGPGYIDTRIRPWNAENTRHRRHGQYYEFAWRSAVSSGASVISVTSFNEWHEGTQIEPAKPASNQDFTYLDYEPEGPDFYMNLTKWWVQHFADKLNRAGSRLSRFAKEGPRRFMHY